MIYVFYGTDFDKVRQKSEQLQEKLNVSTYRFNGENFDLAKFEELIKSTGLFEEKHLVVLDRVFENTEAKDYILNLTKDLGDSSHIFIFQEVKIDKASLSKIDKQAEKVETFNKEKKTEEKFNVFSLTNALEKRDKRQLWILYQTARSKSAPEEIHGLLWWTVKTMILSGRGGRYSIEELRKIASRLVSMYHDAHRGLFEFDLALEKFILEI